MKFTRLPIFSFCACLLLLSHSVLASSSDDPAIDDQPLREALSLPDWFKLSFLDIQEDIDEAKRAKRGLILYFGQKYCPYCKALLKNNWGRRDIVAYTRANFDVVAIDVRGNRSVTDIDGKTYPENLFADKYEASFTPTLFFFDSKGKPALKLTGYRRIYQFRAALEYVADQHHLKENFRSYLARAEGAESFGKDELNESDLFLSGPYDLQKIVRQKPLAVFFEERKCHACDVLHAGPMRKSEILSPFKQLNSVQLDMWSTTPVITPSGNKTTAKKWADQLALDYAPTLIFFDESGKEILRVDSVVGFFRLRNVLKYVTTRAYREQPSYNLWRMEQANKRISN